jgi:hypothetical protein
MIKQAKITLGKHIITTFDFKDSFELFLTSTYKKLIEIKSWYFDQRLRN